MKPGPPRKPKPRTPHPYVIERPSGWFEHGCRSCALWAMTSASASPLTRRL